MEDSPTTSFKTRKRPCLLQYSIIILKTIDLFPLILLAQSSIRETSSSSNRKEETTVPVLPPPIYGKYWAWIYIRIYKVVYMDNTFNI